MPNTVAARLAALERRELHRDPGRGQLIAVVSESDTVLPTGRDPAALCQQSTVRVT